MNNTQAAHLADVIAFFESNSIKRGETSLSDIMRLAELMAASMEGFFATIDTFIYQDFSEIAREIGAMKQEIARLHPGDMKHNRIPEAGRELDAIVEATEEATHNIMAAAEEIMGADADDLDTYQALVNDKMVEIFEACAFQDITGQRITKVVSTLNYIDDRVSTFVERLKLIDDNGDVAHPVEETEEERRRRELILHGPQHKGEGVGQDDIDALLADDTIGAEQSEIDKLFD